MPQLAPIGQARTPGREDPFAGAAPRELVQLTRNQEVSRSPPRRGRDVGVPLGTAVRRLCGQVPYPQWIPDTERQGTPVASNCAEGLTWQSIYS